MKPPELNLLIASLTNYFYCELEERDFVNLGLFLSLLSRDMLAMETIRRLTIIEEKAEKKEQHDD